MERRIRELQQARVLVVGDLILDRYWYGATERISPEAPVPVVRVSDFEDRAGGAANVAANAAALGARVKLIGIAGGDDDADRIARLCREAAVDLHMLRVPGYRTVAKHRVICQHQQLLRMDFESADIDVTAAEALLGLVAASTPGCGVMVLSDYAKGCVRDPGALIRIAKAAGSQVVVDPKGRDFLRYSGADVITPNLAEFEAVVGRCGDLKHVEERARALCGAGKFAAVLVTRGNQGMSLIPADAPAVHLAARARDVYDVTGAGDTVCAVIATAMAAGQPLTGAIALANAAAGLAVAKLGTAVVSADELARAVRERSTSESRIVSQAALLAAVGTARSRGERIVMTNGCFDILHAGHVRYLEQAAELGDRLIVAVNSDASIKRLKDSSRPVNGLDQRLVVLGALSSVDWVVAFDEDTPRALIARVKPDILVKGGDYDPAAIAGAEEVQAAGGTVMTLPYHEGLSTSEVIARARGDQQAGQS